MTLLNISLTCQYVTCLKPRGSVSEKLGTKRVFMVNEPLALVALPQIWLAVAQITKINLFVTLSIGLIFPKLEDTIMAYLIQEDKRAERKEGSKALVIGLHIMSVESNRKYRLHAIAEKAATSDYVRSRAIFYKTTLPRGRYVLVPTTFEPGEIGDFMLRIFTTSSCDAKELTKSLPKHSAFSCVSYPTLVTRITVRAATGLEKQDHFGGADPYCIIKCEGEKVRTFTVKDNLNPTWNTSAVFFRKNANSPIKVQVWNSNVVVDSYMGKGVFTAPVNNQPVIHEVDLFGRRREKGMKRPGKLIVEVNTCNDLQAF